MSELVPNLAELAGALPRSSDAVELLAAFDTARVPAARDALRALVAGWEQPEPQIALDAGPDEEASGARDLFTASR